MNLHNSIPRSRAPLTVVRGIHSALSGRRMATKDDARKLMKSFEMKDDMFNFDRMTVDAAGAFLIGELERLDPRVHEPLVSLSWTRDIDVRTDVSMGDEFSSFTNSNIGAPGGIPGSNKAWIAKNATSIVNVSLDMGKTITPLALWAMQVDWTIPELASAQKLARPIDTQKFDGMQLKYQMDLDEQTYIGDSALGMNGLLNHSAITNTGNALTGGWATATPAQILADVNAILASAWSSSGWAIIPNRLLVSPTEFGILVSTLISSAGNSSVLKFVLENNLATRNGQQLEIYPCKWLIGTANNGFGPATSNSMFAYTKDPVRVRLPLVPLQRTAPEYRDIRQITTYFGRIGGVETPYPETIARRSNLG